MVQKQNPKSNNDRKHGNERAGERGWREVQTLLEGCYQPLWKTCVWRRRPGYGTSWGRGPVLGPADGAIGRVPQESCSRGQPVLDSEDETWGEFSAPSACSRWLAARRSLGPCGEERRLPGARSAKSMGNLRVTGNMQPGILIHPWTRATKH